MCSLPPLVSPNLLALSLCARIVGSLALNLLSHLTGLSCGFLVYNLLPANGLHLILSLLAYMWDR